MPWTWWSRRRAADVDTGNREAVLASARRLFIRDGYLVPMTAIAHDAGVGQAELYRHFSSRLDLALAVFAENLDRLEELAERAHDEESFNLFWEFLIDLTIDCTAFPEMVLNEPDLPPDPAGERIESLIAGPLARAQRVGLVDPDWTAADVKLVVTMASAVAAANPGDKRAAVTRALELIDPRLAPVRTGTGTEGLHLAV